MGIRLTGINPLAYMGVEPYTPPALLIQDSPPTANDFQNVNVGTFWLIMSPQQLYYLASVAGGTATWIQLYPAGSGGAAEFPCNVGTANEASGILNILGDGVAIQTSGAGNTVTISILGEVATSFHADSGVATPAGGVIIMAGGLNINTFASGESVAFNLNDNVIIPGTLEVSGNTTLDSNLTLSSLGTGVVQTNSSGLVSSSTGTNGQVLIGGGTHPQWANITSTGGTVIITNGANSINLESEGGGGGGSTVAFAAYQNTDVTINFGSNVYSPYVWGTGLALTTTLNAGGGFFPGDGVGTPASFTAPVTGKYLFNINGLVSRGTGSGFNSVTNATIQIVNPEYPDGIGETFYNPSGGAISWSGVNVKASIITNMSAGDVATFRCFNALSQGGVTSWTLSGNETPNDSAPTIITAFPSTYVNGCLLSQNAVTPGSAISFFAYQPSNYNVPPVAAGPGYSQASYSLGSSVVLTNPTNAGGAFYPGNGTGNPASFTAPVRGRYAFSFTSALRQGNDTLNANLIFEAFCAIVAPSYTYLGWTGQNVNPLSSFLYSVCTATAVVQLDVNDQVTFQTWGPILLSPQPGGAYCYQVLGVITTSVYPAGNVDYNPTYIQGWLLEEF